MANTPSPVPEWVYKPQDMIYGFIVTFLVERLLRPMVGSIIDQFAMVVDTILIAFVGDDYVPSATGQLGLADVPVWLAVQIIGLVVRTTTVALNMFAEVNTMIATVAGRGGLAAAPIVTILWVLEVALVAWIVWRLIRMVDVPVVNLGPILSTITAPGRFFWRLIR